MPRVPQFESQVQEQRTQLGGSRVPSPNVGNQAEQQARQQLGQAVKETSDLALKIKEKEVEKATRFAVNMAEQTYMDKEEQLLWGPNGYNRQTGANAVRLYQQVVDERKKMADEIMNTLTPRQKELYQQRELRNRRYFQQTTNRHFTSELKKTNIRVLNKKIENLMNRASANSFDDKFLDENSKAINEAIHERAEELGMTKEEFENDSLRVKSAWVRAIASNRLRTDDVNGVESAEKFLKKYDKHLTHDDRVKIHDRLTDKKNDFEASNHLDKLLEIHGGKLSEVRSSIKEIKDDDVKKRAYRKLDSHVSNLSATKRIQDKENWETSVSTIEEAKIRSGGAGVDIYDENVIDQGLIRGMSRKERKLLDDIARGRHETDLATYSSFNNLTGDQLRAMDLDELKLKYLRFFDNNDQDTALNKIKDAKDGIDKRIGGETQNEYLWRRLAESGLVTGTSKTGGNKKTFDKYDRNLGPYITRARAKNEQAKDKGKSLDKIWEESVDSLLKEVLLSKGFFGVDRLWADKKIRGGVLTPEQKENIYIPINEIPDAKRTRLESMIRKQRNLDDKVKVPERDIERAYAADVLDDDTLFTQIVRGESNVTPR